MTARLPIVGNDDGAWASILNGFLSVEHNADGTHHFTSMVVGTATGSTIGMNVLSASTSAPAVVAQASAYYGLLAFNVTDAGSDVANANQIGIVGQSAYSNAGYFQQGATTGNGSTLARNNAYPALYLTRVIGSLNGFNFTQPVLRVDDTLSANAGVLVELKKNGTVVASWDKNGLSFAGSGNGTALGPGLAVSSNTFRFSGGTSGFIWVTQDNGTQLMQLTSAGALGIVDGITAPSTLAGIAYLYVDTADGDLKVKFGDGVVKTIVVDT